MKIARLALMLIGTLFAASNGTAASIELYQGGWDVGGPLTITFSGVDSNSDSGIDLTELTQFSAVFKLPSGDAIEFDLTNLENDGFFYSPDSFFMRAASASYSLYDLGDATTGSFGAISDISSVVAITVDPLQPVPEPATGGLLVTGFAGLMVAVKRRIHPIG